METKKIYHGENKTYIFNDFFVPNSEKRLTKYTPELQNRSKILLL